MLNHLGKLVLLVLHSMWRCQKVSTLIPGLSVLHIPYRGSMMAVTCILICMLFAENWQELVRRIKSKGMRPGVALRPGTPTEEVCPLVSSLTSQSCEVSERKFLYLIY